MRPSVFAILVVAVTTACFVNPSDAQLPTVEVFPTLEQRVCQRDTVSFNCRTNGNTVVFSIPGIDANQIFNVFSSEDIQTCRPTTNFATTCRVLEDVTDNTTFTGTLLYYIQPDQGDGTFRVLCNALGSGGQTTNHTSLRVDVAINETETEVVDESMPCYCVVSTSGDSCTSMYTVCISWPSSDNVDHFELSINGTNYTTSENKICLNLPAGDHNTTVLATNGCGTYNYTNPFSVSVNSSLCATLRRQSTLPCPPPPICPPTCVGICVGLVLIFLVIGHGSGCLCGYVIRSKKKCKPEQSVKTSDHKLSGTSEKCEKF